MKEIDPSIKLVVKSWIWSVIVSFYVGCLAPLFLDGWSIESLGGVCCMAILVTYMLTRIWADIWHAEDLLAAALARLFSRFEK